jgi:hypothetical protein
MNAETALASAKENLQYAIKEEYTTTHSVVNGMDEKGMRWLILLSGSLWGVDYAVNAAGVCSLLIISARHWSCLTQGFLFQMDNGVHKPMAEVDMASFDNIMHVNNARDAPLLPRASSRNGQTTRQIIDIAQWHTLHRKPS